jgi:hypothetical protein
MVKESLVNFPRNIKLGIILALVYSLITAVRDNFIKDVVSRLPAQEIMLLTSVLALCFTGIYLKFSKTIF